MNNAWHFALDFGTSNTSAAHTAPMTNAIDTVALTHRSNLMPSAVYFENDRVLTGDTALSRGRRDASQLLLSPKRYIDHDNVQLGGQTIELIPLISAVIAAAKERAKAQHAGTEPTTVTLTHPEAWSVHSVDQLKAAARGAGVKDEDIRTISEPRAAAIHYAAQQKVDPGKHVAVFDFGGGTLDIAVLQAEEDGNFKVVSAKGDNSLGGRTVDNLLFRWVLSQLEHDDPDFADYVRKAPVSVMHSLEESIREAKEILSDTSSATINVNTPGGEQDLLITRDEFNQVIDSSISRGVELTRAALDQAGVNAEDTPIYMTGGSSRIPYVQNRLAEIGTVMTLDDPKTVVSRGALRATMHGFSAGGDGKPVAGAGAGAAGVAATGAAGAGAAGAHAASTLNNPFANNNNQGASPYGNAPYGNQNQGQSQGQSPFGAGAPGAAPQGASNAYGAQQGMNQPMGFMGQNGAAGNTGAQGTGKSKMPMILGGAAAAVLLLGIGGFALFGGGKDKGGDEENNASGGDTSAAAPAAPASPATGGGDSAESSSAGGLDDSSSEGSDDGSSLPDTLSHSYDERHIVTREPEIKDVLPAQYLNSIDTCLDKRNDYPPMAIEDSDAKFYTCLADKDALGVMAGDLSYDGSRYIWLGEDAKAAYEDFKKPVDDWKAKEYQKGGNGQPEIFYMVNDYGTGYDDKDAEFVIYYPDKGVLVQHGPISNFEKKADSVLKYFGFKS